MSVPSAAVTTEARAWTEAERHQARRCSDWLDTRAAGVELGGMSPRQVRRLVAMEQIQAFDASLPGGRPTWRFRPEWVAAYRARRMRMPRSEPPAPPRSEP